MSKVVFKIFVLTTLFFIFLILYVIHPEQHISYYHEVIKNQENKLDENEVGQSDIQKLKSCRKGKDSIGSDECFRDFYYHYTLKNGVEKAFAHLAAVEFQEKDLIPGCHYLAHGIGHASLVLNGENVYKAFTIMDSSKYFKNIATCGNGYYHGVIEELAKEEKDKDKLVKLLKPICENQEIKKIGNCAHGVGHAAYVQTGNLKDSLYICDNLTQNKYELFGCYSGVFMQEESENPDFIKITNGVMEFTTCNSVEEKYRTACYMEQSSGENFSKERMNYTRNIGFCRQISEPLYRMACIKLNAIRAERIARYENILEMCTNTSSRAERVMCTAIVAKRVGLATDKTGKSESSKQATRDICNLLPVPDALPCLSLAFEHAEQLFYTSSEDLTLHTPTINILKIYFNF